MTDIYKVLLVEDDPDFVFLIQQVIDKCEKLSFLRSVRRGEEGVALAKKLKPDVVLMDMNLPGGMDGEAAARAIRLATNAKVLMLTAREEPEVIIRASIYAFASGYIFKSQCQDLVDVILHTLQCRTPQALFIRELALSGLSSAERGVLEMLNSGNFALHSADKTIANQKTSIFRKLGLRNTAELMHILNTW